MRKNFALLKISFVILAVLPIVSTAQEEKIFYMRPSNWRPYDQTGINVFETTKQPDSVPFEGLRVRLGAAFTQQFQNLKHTNPDALNNDVGSFFFGTSIPGNKLRPITPGFQTAQANLYLDVQLAPGITLNVTTYLSTKHHEESWVKGGYIQFDDLPFKSQFWKNIMKVTTIKIGHFEINYGDEHFRRSDGGQALYNPFMEGNIMDEFATEIGGEVYVRKNGLMGMIGLTNGMIFGNVDSLYKRTNPDGHFHKSPSLLLKAGFDKKLDDAIRLRMTASYYRNSSSVNNTLFGGDRAGSNYQNVMEENSTNPTSPYGPGNFLAFSGRFNPGFSKKVNAIMFNGFLKARGLELFGTYETASGRTAYETSNRTANQFAADAVFRFGKNENLFIGARYNSVIAALADNAAGTGAGPIVYSGDVKINRVAFAGGWFLTKNILMKCEYVDQRYKDFPAADYRAGGRFHGYVIEAVVGF